MCLVTCCWLTQQPPSWLCCLYVQHVSLTYIKKHHYDYVVCMYSVYRWQTKQPPSWIFFLYAEHLCLTLCLPSFPVYVNAFSTSVVLHPNANQVIFIHVQHRITEWRNIIRFIDMEALRYLHRLNILHSISKNTTRINVYEDPSGTLNVTVSIDTNSKYYRYP